MQVEGRRLASFPHKETLSHSKSLEARYSNRWNMLMLPVVPGRYLLPD